MKRTVTSLFCAFMRPPSPGCALVRLRAVAARIDGADRDAAAVLHDLDPDGRRVVAAGALLGDHFDLVAAGGLGADVAVDALDLDRLSLGDRAVPVEVLRPRKSGDQRKRGSGGVKWSASCRLRRTGPPGTLPPRGKKGITPFFHARASPVKCLSRSLIRRKARGGG